MARAPLTPFAISAFGLFAILIANGLCRATPCANALQQRAVCDAANEYALQLLSARHLTAGIVMQDVRTGALLVFATSQGSAPGSVRDSLSVGQTILPLSLSKLFLAASWWDRNQTQTTFECRRENQGSVQTLRMSVHEMLVSGCDLPAKQMASALRKSAGAEAVIADFKRFGFEVRSTATKDLNFWAQLEPKWRDTLIPFTATAALSTDMTDKEWEDTLSLGEANLHVTLLHISYFLQAVGNGGRAIRPTATAERTRNSNPPAPRSLVENGPNVMSENTARRLQSALRDVVQRGSAKTIASALAGSGWQIGGKTGTGPGIVGPESDGWFAGLIFNPAGNARYTVATFVKHGGPGRGNAARISSEMAAYLIGRPAR